MALPVLLGATLPSVDDCSRSAPPAPTQGWLECLGMGGWLPSESPAGISRNARLECVGIRIYEARDARISILARFDPETGYVDADCSDRIEETACRGAGHTFFSALDAMA